MKMPKPRISFLLFVLFSFSIQVVRSQSNKKRDSLLKVFNEASHDTIKIKAANALGSYFMYRDIEEAQRYANEQLVLGERLNDLEGLSKANHQLSIIYSSQGNYDSTLHYIERTLDLVKKTGNQKQESLSRHSRVILEIDRGHLDEAMKFNKENIIFNQRIQDTLGLALSYDTEASIFTEKGQYFSSLKSVKKSLEIFKALDKQIRIADSNHKLAIIENSLEHYDSALEYSAKALEIYLQNEDLEFEAASRNVAGISFKALKDYDKAKAELTKAMDIAKHKQYPGIELTGLAHLVDIHLDLGENQQAKALLDSGLALSRKVGYQQMISYLNARMARYYKNQNQYSLAHRYLDSTDQAVSQDPESLAMVYKLKSEVFEAEQDYRRALSYYQQHKELQDSTSKKTNANRINELRVIHQTEQREFEISLQQEEIKSLNEQARADKFKNRLFSLGMASTFVFAGLLSFGFNQRIKKTKIERQKQEELLRKEIEHKQKELASQTLHLVQKNTFLQELKENLDKIKSSPATFKTEYRRIAMLLKKENSSDKDWEIFKTYFAEVHNDFDQKLKTFYPDISEKDIRLSAFLRMNLTTKEIAATLNVLPESIFKSKYRLKQKLGLDKDTDLVSFLSSL